MANSNSYWESTKAQNDVERYVDEYWREHFHSPSYREIMAGVNAKSTCGIYKALVCLEKNGRIINRGKAIGTTSRQIVPIWVIEVIKAHSKSRKTREILTQISE